MTSVYRCVHKCRPEALEIADAGHEIILTCNNCGTREHRPKCPSGSLDLGAVNSSASGGRIFLPPSIKPSSASSITIPEAQSPTVVLSAGPAKAARNSN